MTYLAQFLDKCNDATDDSSSAVMNLTSKFGDVLRWLQNAEKLLTLNKNSTDDPEQQLQHLKVIISDYIPFFILLQ